MSSEKEIKCRKCGGAHLTIKCGKIVQNNTSNIIQNDINNILNNDNEKKPYNSERKPYNSERKPYDGERKPYNKKLNVKVKINNLPTDISKEELYELCNNWGNIKYINVNGYKEESVAFIEFREEEQCKYFIEALDNTPFDYRIIKILQID